MTSLSPCCQSCQFAHDERLRNSCALVQCGTIQTNMNCLVEDDNNESTPVSSKQIVMDSANWKPAMI